MNRLWLFKGSYAYANAMHYASEMLKKWLGCSEYVLVDVWTKQDNFLMEQMLTILFKMSDLTLHLKLPIHGKLSL